MIDLPTAADIDKFPESAKAKIARHSREKGSNYERDVAKKIAGYFGYQWGDAFIRTKPHGHAQPEGDLKIINQVGIIWKTSDLGPLECKNRKEWSFDQLFKNPKKSKLYGYWAKSNEDTKKDNSVVVFTKPGVTDYALHIHDGHLGGTYITFIVDDVTLIIQTLQNFLISHWSDPHSVL